MCDIFKNGCRWIKADFHLHTRTDSNFKWNDQSQKIFSDEYISKLLEADIHLGVITNHNKFDKSEFKELKKKASKSQIGLFAGVELSTKEGVHILVVFDDAWYRGEENQIQSFLNNAFYGISNPTTPPYPNSRFDLKAVVENMDEIGHDYFICMAHIDDASGLHSVLSGRTLTQFIKQEAFSKVVALQKSGNKKKYDELCKLIGRPVACVEGTDNAEQGLDAIGTGRSTYIKIGEFNFEALKYALLDPENRITPKTEPTISNSYIKSISIEGGVLNDNTIELSPELNTLIGIRGSGKSSVLELIRYTLGIELTDLSVDKEYKAELVPYVLESGGKVTLICVDEHGKEYSIVKILDQKEDIYLEGQRIDATIEGCLKQPIYFGQKDLSNKNINFEGSLIDKLIGNNLANVRHDIAEQEQSLRNSINNYQELSQLDEQIGSVEERISNTNHKLKVYKEKGIDQKLKKQELFESDIVTITSARDHFLDFYKHIFEHIEHYQELFDKIPKLESNEIDDQHEKFSSIFSKLSEEYNNIGQSVENMSSMLDELETIISDLSDKRESKKDEFAKIQRELDIPKLSAGDFLKLKRQLKEDGEKLKNIKSLEKSAKKYNKEIRDKSVALDKLWHDEFKQLQKQIEKINEADNELSIEIVYKGRKDKFLDKMKAVYVGSNIRKASYDEIAKKYSDFVHIFKDNTKLDDILNETQRAEFLKRLNENLADLLTYHVENKFIIKYQDKPLAQHSLGQRASALILFLLAQKDCEIIIIDQPEDDLDNQTIYNHIIRELKKLKGNMQFIFATHNANIPVLGDSEKVITCSVSESNISIDSGNVDKHSTQKNIIDVMEGGMKAFEHRKKIYGIWKAHV